MGCLSCKDISQPGNSRLPEMKQSLASKSEHVLVVCCIAQLPMALQKKSRDSKTADLPEVIVVCCSQRRCEQEAAEAAAYFVSV